ERNRDGVRRHDQAIALADVLEIDPGDRELRLLDRGRLRKVDRDEAVLSLLRDPRSIGGRRSAEEDEIEILELGVGDRRDDARLVRDIGESACLLLRRGEQRDAIERKRAVVKDRLDLVSDERQRIDDSEAVASLRLRLGHGRGFITDGGEDLSGFAFRAYECSTIGGGPSTFGEGN